MNFIIEDLKTQKQQKVHYDRLKKFKFRQHEYQKQGKLAERPPGNDEEVDRFIEIEVKQQSAGVSDQGTKTEELPSQIEVNPEVGQSVEGLFEPKPESETLMDTNMEAKSNVSGAQPTGSDKTKLNSTPSETSSKTKTATQGKSINSTTRDHGENQSSSKRVTRSSSRQASDGKDQDGKPGPGRVTVETSEKPNTRPAAGRSKPSKFKDYFLHKDMNEDQGDDIFD